MVTLLIDCFFVAYYIGMWNNFLMGCIMVLVLFVFFYWCVVLCCVVLCCVVLCCSAVYCTVLYCAVLYCTVLYCTFAFLVFFVRHSI